MQNIKDEIINEKKDNFNNPLTLDESLLLNKILKEYNDLFPEIMHLKKADFLPYFQKYIQIYFASKNILFSTDILNKIMTIILNDYYIPEKEKIDNMIQSSDKKQIFIDNDNRNYIPHCYKTHHPVHICGDSFFQLDNGKYFYCLKCNKIYEQKSVLLFCVNCQKEYYSEIKENNNIINRNKIEYKLKPATWANYHCNASMNDTMKCPKCFNNFYLNMKKRLFCIKCNYEIDQFDIKWKCQICGKEFLSEAKEYNPIIFKHIKLTVKRAIFNDIEARPPIIPCCMVSEVQLKTMKFMHKKECKGLLYEGILDNKKIVICLKCNMVDFYDNHFWLCPICKKKFCLYNNNFNNNYNYEENSDDCFKKEKKNFYQTEKNQNKYKKFMKNKSEFIPQKLSNNFENKFKPISYRIKDKNEKSIEDKNFIFKNYKSGILQNSIISNFVHNKTDLREKTNRNYNNLNLDSKNYKNNEKISDNYYSQIKNKLNQKREFFPFNFTDENNKKSKLIHVNKRLNNLKYENNNIKRFEDINEEISENNNNSSKFIQMINYINKKQKKANIQNYLFKKGYKSKKDNNINSMHNIINNLSNININLNVNVNINNSQKEKLLKNMSSYKDIQRKQYLSKDNNKNIKLYRKHLKNLSIDLSKNLSQLSLLNLDIDDYNIVKSIGEGSFGKIFEVEDKYHRHFAMKKLVCNSLKEIEILKKEYEFLYNFENFNINLVQIYGIETKKLDRTTFVMYVLMELAKTDWEKEILQRKLNNNYYSEKELVLILKDLSYTLSKLQQNNISHRDIKPQNILLCEGDILKISDFGEAKENLNNNINDTVKQTIRGTELYMSPALFKSLKQKIKTKYTKHNTYKSDVFSLGYCILLAASLNFDCLYSIREINDMNIIRHNIKTFLNERYSEQFLNIILIMIENEEKKRPDFIQLEKILKTI